MVLFFLKEEGLVLFVYIYGGESNKNLPFFFYCVPLESSREEARRPFLFLFFFSLCDFFFFLCEHNPLFVYFIIIMLEKNRELTEEERRAIACCVECVVQPLSQKDEDALVCGVGRG